MSAINRKIFFDKVMHSTLFNGHLDQDQVDGMDETLNVWESFDHSPEIAGLGYTFATNWWEARLPPDWLPRMQPVEEVGKGAGRPYGIPDPVTGFAYYGRGDVQLTWADNYKRIGVLLNLPLYTQPELALDQKVSKQVLVRGMIGGVYTPKAGPLSRYFPPGGPFNWIGARQMVNVEDHAQDIAVLGQNFYKALQAATA